MKAAADTAAVSDARPNGKNLAEQEGYSANIPASSMSASLPSPMKERGTPAPPLPAPPARLHARRRSLATPRERRHVILKPRGKLASRTSAGRDARDVPCSGRAAASSRTVRWPSPGSVSIIKSKLDRKVRLACSLLLLLLA
ncbi:unnamed protein product [Lampetra fluviatilis]